MSERFTDHGDGTLTDNRTGLMWAKDAGTPAVGSCAGGIKTWQGALDYVTCLNGINHLGHSDWKLPGVGELKSLVIVGKRNPFFRFVAQGFTNVQSDGYWSSSSHADGTYDAWVVWMWDGGVHANAKADSNYVWPVR